MALQHFYSRVPAKVSLYNKADSLDTFACSEGLTEELMTGELSLVYNSKPAKDETDLIRNGKIPPVYFHYTGKSGELIQSSMTFLPLDYAGERTGYMVHSLVMSSEEKDRTLRSPDGEVLNKDYFTHDLSGFDFNSFESKPITDYPAVDYVCKKATPPSVLCEKYDKDMLKRLIYSLISISCGKGKSVYISLHNNLETVSEDFLEFFNSIFQIFPYCLRDKLPFVTYTSDVAKYSSFKVKGMLESGFEVPSMKGITLHFGPDIALGLKDDVVQAEGFLVDFFYGLMKNEDMRIKFLEYIDHAVSVNPELYNMSTKTLRELVLLFCECAGFFAEGKILSDENIISDFIIAYEKHRTTMIDEYRAVSMRCFHRYPVKHEPIPTRIFARVSKIYPDEIPASRADFLNTALELIHTDTMRDKLFAFVRTNYPDENPETKEKIVFDLCRVYYGGFLRSQILDFFTEIFGDSNEAMRAEMFDKILLTIRTDAVRAQIMEFIRRYYNTLTDDQKEKFFITYDETLGEADDLSKEFSQVVGEYFDSETEDLRSLFELMLYQTVINEMSRPDHKVVRFIGAYEFPFLNKILSKKLFTDWKDQDIFGEYCGLIFSGKFSKGIGAVITAFEAVPDMDKETADLFYDKIHDHAEAKAGKIDITTLVNADTSLSTSLSGTGLDFGRRLCEEIIRPQIYAGLGGIFAANDGLNKLSAYEDINPDIKNREEYSVVVSYGEMTKALSADDFAGFFTVCAGISDANTLKNMLKCIKSSDIPLSTDASAALSMRYALVEKAKPVLSEVRKIYEDKPLPILLMADRLLKADSSETLRGLLLSEDGTISSLLDDYFRETKTKGGKEVLQAAKETPYDPYLAQFVTNSVKKNKAGGLLMSIFGK